jgi:hypothetical protein
VKEECWHVCPGCYCDWRHWVPCSSNLDLYLRYCRRCVASGRFDVIGHYLSFIDRRPPELEIIEDFYTEITSTAIAMQRIQEAS